MMIHIYNLYLEGRSVLARSDFLYPLFIWAISGMRPEQSRNLVRSSTEIVITGFQRSANTYFTSFFALAQPRPVAIARHLHETYQVRYAARRGIPCIVLVRPAVDAVASAALRDPRMRPGTALRNYIRFHQEVLFLEPKPIIALFDEVTKDGNAVIARVNAAYGTAFSTLAAQDLPYVMAAVEKEDKQALKTEELDQLRASVPSPAKSLEKAKLIDMILENHTDLVDRAKSLYARAMQIQHEQVRVFNNAVNCIDNKTHS